MTRVLQMLPRLHPAQLSHHPAPQEKKKKRKKSRKISFVWNPLVNAKNRSAMKRPVEVAKKCVSSNNITFPAQGLLLPPPTACVNMHILIWLQIISSPPIKRREGVKKMLRDSRLVTEQHDPSLASVISLSAWQCKIWGFLIEHIPSASTPVSQLFLLQPPRRKCYSEHHTNPTSSWEQPGQHSHVLHHTSPYRPHIIISWKVCWTFTHRKK